MNGWTNTPYKQWLFSWLILYGGSFVIAETIDPELGFWIAAGVTGLVIFFSPQSGTLLSTIQTWIVQNVLTSEGQIHAPNSVQPNSSVSSN